MKFLLSISSSKEMGDGTRQRKNSPTTAGIEPRPPDLDEFDRPLRTRPDGTKPWKIMPGSYIGGGGGGGGGRGGSCPRQVNSTFF